MSRTEVHVGKAKYLGSSTEDICREIANENNLELGKKYDSYKELISEEFYENGYAITDSGVYKILKDEELDDLDISHATQDQCGIIDYVVSYYNGGCVFVEAFADAIDEMEKKGNK